MQTVHSIIKQILKDANLGDYSQLPSRLGELEESHNNMAGQASDFRRMLEAEGYRRCHQCGKFETTHPGSVADAENPSLRYCDYCGATHEEAAQ